MDAGKIVAEGSPAQLKAEIGTDVVTVRIQGEAGELARAEQTVRGLEDIADARTVDDSIIVYVPDGAAAVARIVLLLNAASLTAREVIVAKPTLDDVFLRATGHHLEAEESHVQRAAVGRRT